METKESPASVYITFRLAEFFRENPGLYKDKTIVIAPLVNPDGFFRTPPDENQCAGSGPQQELSDEGLAGSAERTILPGTCRQQRK